jgi:hypothetical protein
MKTGKRRLAFYKFYDKNYFKNKYKYEKEKEKTKKVIKRKNSLLKEVNSFNSLILKLCLIKYSQ